VAAPPPSHTLSLTPSHTISHPLTPSHTLAHPLTPSHTQHAVGRTLVAAPTPVLQQWPPTGLQQWPAVDTDATQGPGPASGEKGSKGDGPASGEKGSKGSASLRPATPVMVMAAAFEPTVGLASVRAPRGGCVEKQTHVPAALGVGLGLRGWMQGLGCRVGVRVQDSQFGNQGLGFRV